MQSAPSITYSHPSLAQANAMMLARLGNEMKGRVDQEWLAEYTHANAYHVPFLDYIAPKLGMSPDDLFGVVARYAAKPVIDPNTFLAPKLSQPQIEGLPAFLLCESPFATATLVTCIPFLDGFMPVKALQAFYGVAKIHTVLCSRAHLAAYSLRLQQNDILQAMNASELDLDKVEEQAILDKLGHVFKQFRLLSDTTGLTLDNFAEKLRAVTKPSEANHDSLTAWSALVNDIPYVALDGAAPMEATQQTVFGVPMQRKYDTAPIALTGALMTLATYRPVMTRVKSEISNMLPGNLVVQYVLAKRADILRMITATESRSVATESMAKRISGDGGGTTQSLSSDVNISELTNKAAPTVTDLVNTLLVYAVNHQATDIHISDQPGAMWVRYRIDGMLHEHSHPFSADLTKQVIARVKIMSGIDTQFSHMPQDGKFSVTIGASTYDIRTATATTVFGEKVVLRIRPKSPHIPSLDDLGFRPHEVKIIKQMLDGDYGLLVVCGPTGSGKSTTLYAALGMVDRQQLNVVTVEEPVEFTIDHTEQTEIKRNSGLTFAKFLPAVLRQDPDIIMIGETRDSETAAEVVRAANTGHIVLTTLHTNDAASAPARFLDLGVQKYLLSDALTAVCAQRLLPRLCSNCSRKAPMPTKAAMQEMGIEEAWFGGATHLMEATGCPTCRNTGTHGRVAIMEAYAMDEAIRDIIMTGTDVRDQIRKRQIELGGKPLMEQAVLTSAAGLTSLKKVVTRGALD